MTFRQHLALLATPTFKYALQGLEWHHTVLLLSLLLISLCFFFNSFSSICPLNAGAFQNSLLGLPFLFYTLSVWFSNFRFPFAWWWFPDLQLHGVFFFRSTYPALSCSLHRYLKLNIWTWTHLPYLPQPTPYSLKHLCYNNSFPLP